MAEEPENPHAAKAWDDFRDQGFADVREATQYCEKQCEVYQSFIGEVSQDFDRQMRLKIRLMERKKAGLELLLNYMVHHGPENVPAWKDLTGEQKNRLQGDLARFIADGTLDQAKRDLKVHREFWKRREQGESAADVMADLAERHNLSEKTIENVVYPKQN